jgi:GNAT superfamily N-acetyltransferase
VAAPPGIRILDVIDAATFERLPPCADARFDHRSCDYWEDEGRGQKTARPSWWQPGSAPNPVQPPSTDDNPFLPRPGDADIYNPFTSTVMAAALDPLGGDDLFATPAYNPFAPIPREESQAGADMPRKLRLLDRGRQVFGSYAKVLLLDDEPAGYAQFGPLSAYPRAQQIRSLYPRLPGSPLPAVITCVATTPAMRARGLARRLVEAVVGDLGARGFAAIEAYPDLALPADEASAASPAFWSRCGFVLVVDDERYPVMRRELD